MSLTIATLIILNLMLVFATTHIALSIQRIIIVFLQSDGSPISYLERLDDPLYLVKNVFFICQSLLGDGFLLYRLILIWERNLYVILPVFVCFLGCIGLGITALIVLTNATEQAIFIPTVQKWLLNFNILTVVTNCGISLFIAGKIWWVNRKGHRLNRVGGPNLATPMILVIESCAIYSGCILVAMSLYIRNDYALYILVDSIPSVVGIVLSLIIIRVGLGLSAYGPLPHGSESYLNHLESDLIRVGSDRRTHRQSEAERSRPLQSLDFRMSRQDEVSPQDSKALSHRIMGKPLPPLESDGSLHDSFHAAQ